MTGAARSRICWDMPTVSLYASLDRVELDTVLSGHWKLDEHSFDIRMTTGRYGLPLSLTLSPHIWVPPYTHNIHCQGPADETHLGVETRTGSCLSIQHLFNFTRTPWQCKGSWQVGLTLLTLNTLLNSMLFTSLFLISLSRNRICGHNYIMCDIEVLPD